VYRFAAPDLIFLRSLFFQKNIGIYLRRLHCCKHNLFPSVNEWRHSESAFGWQIQRRVLIS